MEYLQYKEMIDKLEKAKEPSKELDLDIAVVVGVRCYNRGKLIAFDYTSNIDDALCLVEKGDLWGIDNDIPGSMHDKDSWHTAWCYGETGQHSYPAIALCIAALKAKQKKHIVKLAYQCVAARDFIFTCPDCEKQHTGFTLYGNKVIVRCCEKRHEVEIDADKNVHKETKDIMV